MPNSRYGVSRGVLALAVACAWPVAWANDSIDDLSLEELSKTEISSVSRRNQSLANVPAAAFVISAEDIRRSGATVLPDVLRMVPGIEVAQIDNGRYAVTARGFNGRFANKLQVLVDGRSIYSTLFSGVMWEHDPVPLDDIERVEVIRGPGAAMWGANAVNGVINIITRHSAAQSGGLIAPVAGTQGFGQLYGRYAGRLDADTTWRFSGQGRHADPSQRQFNGQESGDQLDQRQLNFRLDRQMGQGSDLAVWANTAHMRLGDLAWLDPVVRPANPPFQPFPAMVGIGPKQLVQTDDSQTLGLRYRWLTGSVESSLQASARRSRVEIEYWFREDRQTYDVDYQGRYAFGSHDLLWGGNYRWVSDDSSSQSPVLQIRRASYIQRSTGVFLHDDWTLIPERLNFAFGSRWEDSNLGGFTFAPSASLMWTPTRRDSIWLKYARAPRVPARAEHDVSAAVTVTQQVVPGVGNVPVMVFGGASPWNLKPEKVESYELGYRLQASSAMSISTTVYRQRYIDRVSGALTTTPSMAQMMADLAAYGAIGVNSYPGNTSGGWLSGFELAADWLVVPAWRLQLSYTAQHLDLNHADSREAMVNNANQEKGTPRHYASLRSQWNISGSQQFDAWLRGSAGYERIRAPFTDTVHVPGYVTLDLRYAYRFNRQWEVSLAGRNLIGGRRVEFVSDYVPTVPVEVRPSLMLGARVEF